MGVGGRDSTGRREPSLLQLPLRGCSGGEQWPTSSFPHSVPASGFLRKNSLFSFSIQALDWDLWLGEGRRVLVVVVGGGPYFLSFFLAWAACWPQISAGSWRQRLRSLPGEGEGEGPCVPSSVPA